MQKRLDLERPLDLDQVLEVVQIAIQAPTSANNQYWHFVLVVDPKRKKQ